MNKNILDIGASIGKFSVERSNLSRDDKELAKSGIDVLSELLKSAQPQHVNLFTVYGFDLANIQRIKAIARQNSIERIVLFPVFYSNGGHEVLIRVYGEDRDKIFNAINVRQLYNTTDSEKSVLDNLEKENGVIIYEKD